LNETDPLVEIQQTWKQEFFEKRDELQQALKEVEWARKQAELIVHEKVIAASMMKEAFRLHVCETKNRLRAEIERLRHNAAEHLKEETSVRRKITKAKIFASIHSRDAEHGRLESIDPEALEVQKSLDKVQRHLSKQQSNLRALRSQIAECVTEVKRSKARVEELRHRSPVRILSLSLPVRILSLSLPGQNTLSLAPR